MAQTGEDFLAASSTLSVSDTPTSSDAAASTIGTPGTLPLPLPLPAFTEVNSVMLTAGGMPLRNDAEASGTTPCVDESFEPGPTRDALWNLISEGRQPFIKRPSTCLLVPECWIVHVPQVP